MKRNIVFSSSLYLGEKIEKEKLNRLKRKLSRRPFGANVYLLSLAQNEKDYIDIIHSKYLIFKFYKKLQIVGLAKDYEEALELVSAIVSDCLKVQNNTDLRTFLN